MFQYLRDNIEALFITDANGFPTEYDLLDTNGVSLLTGSTPAFQVPNTFAANQWSLTTGSDPAQIIINISVLPANNGSPITSIQYRVGNAAWVTLPGVATGAYPVTMAATSTAYDISLRAVNIVGPSAQSVAKTVTSGAPAATAPAAFGPAQWSLATGTEPASLTLNILSLPSNGGSAITAIEYKVGSGEWVALADAETGPRSITMPQGSTSYSVTIRAVNAVNAGPVATAKTATSAAPAQQAPSVQTSPSITGSTTVGSILTRTAGTATGNPTPTRATVWLRNGEVIAGQTGNTLDTSGFAADDVITTRDDWTNSQGTASGTSAPWTLTVQPAITATIDLQPAGQQSSITFNVAIDGSPTIAQGSTSITATRVGTTNQWTFVAPIEGPISFAATKAGHTAFSDATRTVAPALSVLAERNYELVIDNDPGSEPLEIIDPQEYAGSYVTPDASLTNGIAVLAEAVISRTGDVITTTRDPLFTWDDSIEPIQFGHAYYRGTTALNATLIEDTEGAISYTVDPALDGGKNVYRRDWLEGAGSDSELAVFSNGIAVAAPANWWVPDSIIDLDFQNSRFRINGTNYASIAEAKTANAIKVNSSGVDYIDVAGLGTAYAIGAKAVTPNTASGATGTYALAVLEDGEDGDTIDEVARIGWHKSILEWRAAGYVRVASTNKMNTTEGLIVAPNSPIRTALRVKSGDYYQGANGQTSGSSTQSGSLPSVSRFMWGRMSTGTLPFTGTIQRVVLVNADLTNDQINALLA